MVLSATGSLEENRKSFTVYVPVQLGLGGWHEYTLLYTEYTSTGGGSSTLRSNPPDAQSSR